MLKHRPSVYLNNCIHHLVMGNYHHLKVGHIRSCLSLVILSTRNGLFVKTNTEIGGGVDCYNTVGKIVIQLTGADLQRLLQGSITNPTAYWLNENVSINLLYWKTS